MPIKSSNNAQFFCLTKILKEKASVMYKGLLVLRHLSLGSLGPVETLFHASSCAEPN